MSPLIARITLITFIPLPNQTHIFRPSAQSTDCAHP
jgi:hypothetical protein